MVLEGDGDQLERSVKKEEVLYIVKRKRNIVYTRKRREDNGFGHILRRT